MGFCGFITVLVCLRIPTRLSAQAFVPLKGDGSVTLAYQYVNVHDHFLGDGTRVQKGRVYSQSAILLTDYGLTDSLAVTLSVPYVQAKYLGLNAHDPTTLKFPNDAPLLDDGTYHGSFQDLGFGVRYNVRVNPVAITPFISVNVPSHDYPFFAHSAIGRDLRQFMLGANVGGRLERLLPN
jgi:hypothetical protein